MQASETQNRNANSLPFEGLLPKIASDWLATAVKVSYPPFVSNVIDGP